VSDTAGAPATQKAGARWARNLSDVAGTQLEQWMRLWQALAALRDYAVRLRHLSRYEPLAQARPGYPRAGLGRPHADEVRVVLDGIQRRLEEIRPIIPTMLPDAVRPGIAADEHPDEIAKRAETLGRLASTLAQEAFRPLPPLPPHAPPYLVEPPGHDLAGTKAVLLAIGLEELTAATRNLMLSATDRTPG
jgi:hypothetical protein